MGRVFVSDDGRLRVGLRLALYLIAFVGSLVVVGIGLGLIYVVLGLTGMLQRGQDQYLIRQIFATALFGVATPVTVFITWLFRTRVDHRSFVSLGLPLFFPRPICRLYWSVACGALPMVVCVALLLATGQSELNGVAWRWSSAAWMLAFLPAAFMEELVFRGYVLKNLLTCASPWVSIVLSSLLFALFHSMNQHVAQSALPMLNLFLAGIMFAQAYRVFDELWTPTAIHVTWNFLQGPIFGISVSGTAIRGMFQIQAREDSNDLLTGGLFGLEGSLLTLIALVVVIVVLMIVYKRRVKTNTSRAC